MPLSDWEYVALKGRLVLPLPVENKNPAGPSIDSQIQDLIRLRRVQLLESGDSAPASNLSGIQVVCLRFT
jgi:hypothetical protein